MRDYWTDNFLEGPMINPEITKLPLDNEILTESCYQK
jgi:hypothetical protein